MKKRNVIYKLYFVDDIERVYIGSAKRGDDRITTHIKSMMDRKHPNKLLQIDFNKKGICNFRWDILEEGIPPKKLLSVENEYIVKYNSVEKGYNQVVDMDIRKSQ